MGQHTSGNVAEVQIKRSCLSAPSVCLRLAIYPIPDIQPCATAPDQNCLMQPVTNKYSASVLCLCLCLTVRSSSGSPFVFYCLKKILITVIFIVTGLVQ